MNRPTRPCDGCARWYPLDLLTLHRDTTEWVELWLCPGCFEWRTGLPPERDDRAL